MPFFPLTCPRRWQLVLFLATPITIHIPSHPRQRLETCPQPGSKSIQKNKCLLMTSPTHTLRICSWADKPKQRPVVPPIPLHHAPIQQAEQILKMGHLPKATPFHLGEASFCNTSLLILSSALGFIFLKYHLDAVTCYWKIFKQILFPNKIQTP